MTCRIKYNNLGKEIEELGEQKGMPQKHVASQLDIDTPMLKEHLPILAKAFSANNNHLLSL